MTKFYRETLCVLCRKVLPKPNNRAQYQLICPNLIWFLPVNPEQLGTGHSVHWDCYLAWPDQKAFANKQFELTIQKAKTNQLHGVSFLTQDVLIQTCVTLQSLDLYFRETGTYKTIDLKKWLTWIIDFEQIAQTSLHPLEYLAIQKIWKDVQQKFPDEQALSTKTTWDGTERWLYDPHFVHKVTQSD